MHFFLYASSRRVKTKGYSHERWHRGKHFNFVASEVENVSSMCAFNVNVKGKIIFHFFYTFILIQTKERERAILWRSAMVSIAACTMVNIANVNAKKI